MSVPESNGKSKELRRFAGLYGEVPPSTPEDEDGGDEDPLAGGKKKRPFESLPGYASGEIYDTGSSWVDRSSGISVLYPKRLYSDPPGPVPAWPKSLQGYVELWLSYIASFASFGLRTSVLIKEFPISYFPLPRKVRRWLDVETSCPERCHDLPPDEKSSLQAWVRDNVAPWQILIKPPKSSYYLKHVAERAIGHYVGNGELKGAMLEAGYEPVWDDQKNMGFKCSPRPQSSWHEEIKLQKSW